MTRLSYFTASAVEALRETVENRLDWYYSPDVPLDAPWRDDLRDVRLPAPTLADKLDIGGGRPSDSDVENAIVAYSALSGLTAHQASIERLWTYLCHCDCPLYVAKRWLKERPPRDVDAAIKVRNHFFAKGNRGLVRDNGVSRLWWLGKIAHDVDPVNPRRFLTMLLHRQDTRSALIERPSVSMSRDVLQGIYAIMEESWETDRRLFERGAFRKWMVALNRRGGVILLDALPREALVSLLRDEGAAAVTEASASVVEHGG